MAERKIGSILVNRHTIDIAGEVVAIAQIVRLRELVLEQRKGFSAGRILLIVVGGFAAFLGTSGFGARSGGGAIAIIGLLLALAALLWSLYSTRKYILAIELASGGLTGLTSDSSVALTKLKEDVAAVIENPPDRPTTIHAPQIFAVDNRGSANTQIGSGNSQLNI